MNPGTVLIFIDEALAPTVSPLKRDPFADFATRPVGPPSAKACAVAQLWRTSRSTRTTAPPNKSLMIRVRRPLTH